MDTKASAVSSGSTAVEMGRGAEDESGSAAMRTTETLLRILPMALCIASLVIMLKNSHTNEYGTLSYSDFGSFKYLVHASGICAGYSLLSAVAAAMPRPSTMSWDWTFFLLDQVLLLCVGPSVLPIIGLFVNSTLQKFIPGYLEQSSSLQMLTYIILAAGAVSAEVVYLAYKGDVDLTWSEACDTYDGFCRKAAASVAITFSATLCYVGVSLISSYRLFTKYEAPLAYTQ